MNEVVSHFHELCSSRFEAHINRHPDVQLHGVSADPGLDIDKQEMLEKAGVFFVRPGGKISGRSFVGLRMMNRLMHLQRGGNYPKWGICRARNGEFIVADNFMTSRCIPVTPSIMLFADLRNFELEFDGVAELNAFNVRRAEQFYFTRNFNACPILRRTILNRRFSVTVS